MSPQTFLALLTVLTVGVTLMAEFRNFEFFEMCLQSSYNLHNMLFWNILRAPMSFFEIQPIGVVLTKFTKDLGILDQTLPLTFLEVLTVRALKLNYIHADISKITIYFQIFIGLLFTMCLTSAYIPAMLFPSIAMLYVCYSAINVYLKTSRPLRRLLGIFSAPVQTQTSSTLQGLATVRSFQIEPLLISDFSRQQV